MLASFGKNQKKDIHSGNKTVFYNVKALTLWLFCCLSLLITSLTLSWQVNKIADFGYTFWYQYYDIEQVIKTYGAKNYNKQDYSETPFEQHQKNFTDIVDAIHQEGKKLKQLKYVNHQQQTKTLLTQAEVIHLTDVSQLIDKLYLLFWINGFIGLMLFYYAAQKKYPLPTLPQKLVLLCSPIVLCVVILSTFGFTESFYYLHTVVFPSDHQWFFYYEESLMSTLMKAPEIFSGITALLAFTVALIFSLSYKLIFPHIFVRKPR
jgi:uncharacterized membrane protein